MKIDLRPGKYVVAVSGGVDSVALLDLLVKKSHESRVTSHKFQFVVAHYDHGIRSDSAKDRKFVENLAKKHQLEFFFEAGQLGSKTSEAEARTKRYEFLRNIKTKTKSKAIITAHHQDDLLETAIINMLRGTGRRGLSSLKSTNEIKRPLLGVTKRQIISYAKVNKLSWREDSTNQDETYLRNWVRHKIIPRLSDKQRTSLLQNIGHASNSNSNIEKTINALFKAKLSDLGLERTWFNQLPHDVAKEIMMAWLRQNGLQFNRQQVEQLVVAAKTYKVGKTADINNNFVLKINGKYLALAKAER